MRVQILLFAGLRQRIGRAELEVEVEEGTSVADLRSVLLKQHPSLVSLPFRVACNRELVRDETQRLVDGVEVALIPPVSGG